MTVDNYIGTPEEHWQIDAPGSGKLTTLSNHLIGRNINGVCNLCNKDSLAVITNEELTEPHAAELTGMPVYKLVCTNCGNVLFLHREVVENSGGLKDDEKSA